MSPQIDLDPDIFDYLKTQAEPLVDTTNTVLRRLLRLPAQSGAAPAPVIEPSPAVAPHRESVSRVQKKAAKAKPTRTRAASGTLLPEDRYERPLLETLVEAGGRAPYSEVVEAVGRKLKDDLMPADFENLNSGAVRWQSRLQFVRLRLIERAYLDKDTPRGIWGISDAGRAALDAVNNS